MKKIFLSLCFAVSAAFISQTSFAAEDTGFTAEQLQGITPQIFDQLSPEKKAELVLLSQQAQVELEAAELFDPLPLRTKIKIFALADGIDLTPVPVVHHNSPDKHIALKMIAKGICLGIPQGVLKHSITGGMGSFF